MKPLRVGLVGAGRMGRLHARVYSQLPNINLAGIVDVDSSQAVPLAQEYQTKVLPTLQDLAAQVQAVSIATPTETHLQIAEPFLKLGIPVLIEKPLAPSAVHAQQLLDLAKQHDTFIQVGHTERFNPAVIALDRYDFAPRFIEAVRVSPFPFRSMDIGAVFDLMIHDIDLILHLTKALPITIEAVGAALLGPHEDLADARLTFADGCVAKLTCSRLALDTTRTLQVFSDDLYISLDLHKKTGFFLSKSHNADRVKDALAKLDNAQAPNPPLSWTDLIQTEPLRIEDTEPMRLQLEDFVHCVRTSAQPTVTGSAAAAAVATAEAIVRAIKLHPSPAPKPASA